MAQYTQPRYAVCTATCSPSLRRCVTTNGRCVALRNVDPTLTGRFFSLGPISSFGKHQTADCFLVSDGAATYSMHTLCATQGMLVGFMDGRPPHEPSEMFAFQTVRLCRSPCSLRRGKKQVMLLDDPMIKTTSYNAIKLAGTV